MERIGWENDRGAYFINKLRESIDEVNSSISDIDDGIEDINGSIEDINDSIEDIETAVEALEDNTTPVAVTSPVTMESGFTAPVLSVHKVGKIVHMSFQFNVSGLTGNVLTKIATLKSDIKPISELYVLCTTGTYAAVGVLCKLIIDTAGVIQISAGTTLSSDSPVRGYVTYISQ